MQDRTITLTTDTGEDIICDILFTYHSEEFNKDYVLFVPRGENEVSAASYKEKGNGTGELEKIENDAEWDMLEELLDDYYNQDDEICGGDCGGCAGCGGNCDRE